MRRFFAVLLLLLVCATPSLAMDCGYLRDINAVLGISNTAGQIGAFDTKTVGTWEQIVGEDGQEHLVYNYVNIDGLDILSTDGSNTVLGTIYSLNYDTKSDPQIIVNFSVRAGSSDSTFSFMNSINVIPNLENPIARASASLTLTDNSVPANGAYANGAFNGMVYNASYNNGTTFANLVNGFSIAGGSQTNSANDPADGVSYRQVSGTVTQMAAEYNFVLKRYDSASGTSNFVMLPVPEPSSILGIATGLFGLLGFAIKKRK